MDKELTVPKWAKWVLINWPKIHPNPKNVSAQIACQSPKVLDFDEKKASLGVRSPWHMVFMREIRTHSQWKPKHI